MLTSRNLRHPVGALLVVLPAVVLVGFLDHLTASQEGSEKPAEASDPRKTFVILFKTGPAFVEGGPYPGMAEHVKFIKARHAEGIVPLAGPLLKGNEKPGIAGMLYFVKARSAEEVRAIARDEPLTQHKVAEIASIWEFRAGVGARRLD